MTPLVSVIIPSVRDSRSLAALLAALRDQAFEEEYEILLVNDRPELDRRGLEFQSTRGACRVIAGEGRGPARARNLGATQARGTYVLFLDDDVEIDSDYLGGILPDLAAHPGCAVSGRQVAIRRDNVFSLTSERLLNYFTHGEASRFAAGNALALRRADFEICGGFDRQFPLAAGEDREFSARWIACGFYFASLESAAVRHHFPDRFTALARQQWRYGRGACHFRRCAPAGQKPRLRSIGYYWRMLADAPREYGWAMGTAIGILCWISQVIVAAGYLRERISPSAAPLAARSLKESCAE